ncbi:MAG TPA: LLM class flavin-dependent oxidoreductase [Candidatus Binatia bacterium]
MAQYGMLRGVDAHGAQQRKGRDRAARDQSGDTRTVCDGERDSQSRIDFKGQSRSCHWSGRQFGSQYRTQAGHRRGERDYIIAVRDLLQNGQTVYRGRRNRFIWPRPEMRQRIPICVTAEGPRMLRLAGEVGDQVLIGTGLTSEIVEASLQQLHEGAKAAERDPDELEVWWAPRLSIAENREKALKDIRASIASSGNHALRSGLAGKYVPDLLKESIRRFHQEYDYSQHGEKTGKNARLIDQLGLTEYLLDRFAVAGTPGDIVQRIRSLARLGLKNLWLSSPGDDPSNLDLMGREVLPHLND